MAIEDRVVHDTPSEPYLDNDADETKEHESEHQPESLGYAEHTGPKTSAYTYVDTASEPYRDNRNDLPIIQRTYSFDKVSSNRRVCVVCRCWCCGAGGTFRWGG